MYIPLDSRQLLKYSIAKNIHHIQYKGLKEEMYMFLKFEISEGILSLSLSLVF